MTPEDQQNARRARVHEEQIYLLLHERSDAKKTSETPGKGQRKGESPTHHRLHARAYP